MLTEILTTIIFVIFLWILLKWKKVSGYWAAKGVPHEPPHPIWGSLTYLQKENPALWVRRMYDKFKSPYIGIWLFHRPALIVNTPELARRILVKDADNFRNRFLSSGKTDPIGSLSIFLLNDPQWSTIRRRLTFIFTASKLRGLQSLVKSKAHDLIYRINQEMKKDPKDFHLKEMLTDYTTDIIGEASFGLKSESTRTGDSAMRKVTREFMNFSIYRGFCWSSIFFFPELVDIFRFSLFPKDTSNFLRQVFRRMIDERGGFKEAPKDPRDLLDALIKMKVEAELDGEEVSEDLLLAQAHVILLGGFETSGGALTWLLYELAFNPEQQEKLHNELIDAQQKYGTDFNYNNSQLAELPYLNAVIKEIGRKYPPMGWLDRIATHDYKIDDKLTISAGTPVYVNGYGMQRDAKFFPNPDVFDPERFMPENEMNIVPHTYMPFGDGPRSCIGMRFAQMTLRIASASLILEFEVKPVPGAPAPNECAIERKGMFLMPDDHMPLRFIPRVKA